MAIALKQPTQRAKQNLREIIVLALFAALMLISKEVLAALPNIEIVTLLIILLAHNIGLRALWSVYTFVAVQLVLYPLGEWGIAYLYVWAILVFAVCALRRYGNAVLYTIIAGIFGILFGVLCSIPSFFIGGFGYGMAWIVRGLSFDVIHCVGNIATVALLFYPLNNAIQKIIK